MSEDKAPYSTTPDPKRAEIEHLLDVATRTVGREDRGQAYLQTAQVSALLLLTDRLATLIDTIDNLSNTLPYLADLIKENSDSPLPTTEDHEELFRGRFIPGSP